MYNLVLLLTITLHCRLKGSRPQTQDRAPGTAWEHGLGRQRGQRTVIFSHCLSSTSWGEGSELLVNSCLSNACELLVLRLFLFTYLVSARL